MNKIKIINAINNYFFDEDTITLSDSLYFYGIMAGILIISLGVWFI